MQGIGIDNIYRLKPILNARILLNTSYTSHLYLHNPHNHSLQVAQVFTSDDDLHLEMPLHSHSLGTSTQPAMSGFGRESASQRVSLQYQKVQVSKIYENSFIKFYTNNNSSNVTDLWVSIEGTGRVNFVFEEQSKAY